MTASEPVRIADAAWLTGGALGKLMAVLDHDGEEARVVGGAVRNILIGESTGEVDVATTALPDEVVRRAKAAGFKAVPTGIEHGTVTIVVDHKGFEVTTLREDVETFGRHAVVRFGRDWKGITRRYYAMPFGERYIWGVTAGILRNLYERIYAA